LAGCQSDRLFFPEQPIAQSDRQAWYDTDGDGRADFAVSQSEAGRLDQLSYDDDQDGQIDRRYNLSDSEDQPRPHLIVLADSLPYEAFRERFERPGPHGLRLFHPPSKVICPFPSMSALCFTALLHAPPMPGMINRHYDPRPQKRGYRNLITKRLAGYRNPWQQRVSYQVDYDENVDLFLKPKKWLPIELERSRQALDDSPYRTTIVYLAAPASMLMQHGKPGLDETLDELERFCLQIMYERRGAMDISIVSDHGHNLEKTQWIDIKQHLKNAGFKVGNKVSGDDAVVLEMDGLLTYFGVHTNQPEQVAEALLELEQLKIVTYQQLDEVVVRSQLGEARIRKSGDVFIYEAITGDVLLYEELESRSLTREQWLSETADAAFPAAPPRLWDAFHGIAVSTPQVMATLEPGYCCGIGWFSWFVNLESTHGGLDQVSSAAVVLTTRPIEAGPIYSRDVLPAIAPSFDPPIVRPNR
jgi:hypothetical protein